MEVYAPIPEELLHRAPPSLRKLATILKIAVVIGAAVLLLHFAYPSTPPMFRNFGVVTTPLGTAVVACGGEVTEGCGQTTALVFDTCAVLGDHFPHAYEDPKGIDAAVRQLTGKRPPGSPQWGVACGFDGLLRDHVADLKPV